MTTKKEGAYIKAARAWKDDSGYDIEIDDDAEVSLAEGGAWVSCWIWITEDEVK